MTLRIRFAEGVALHNFKFLIVSILKNNSNDASVYSYAVIYVKINF